MAWRNGNIARFIVVGAVLTAMSALFVPSVAAQTSDGVEAAINGFLAAFDDLDMPKFITYFAEDATIFHPPSLPPRTFPTRLHGRREIERTFQLVFDQIRQRSGRANAPYMNLAPEDLLIQRFDGLAVVTFHLGTEMVRGRRTLVLRRVGSDWKIVHLHASTFNVDQK
jgi:ketosteroid isomerase-like protein